MEKDTLEIILGENIARYRNLAGMTQWKCQEMCSRETPKI